MIRFHRRDPHEEEDVNRDDQNLGALADPKMSSSSGSNASFRDRIRAPTNRGASRRAQKADVPIATPSTTPAPAPSPKPKRGALKTKRRWPPDPGPDEGDRLRRICVGAGKKLPIDCADSRSELPGKGRTSGGLPPLPTIQRGRHARIWRAIQVRGPGAGIRLPRHGRGRNR